MLKNEVTQLKQLLLTHKDCPITAMQKESQGYLSESSSSLIHTQAWPEVTLHNEWCILLSLFLVQKHTCRDAPSDMDTCDISTCMQAAPPWFYSEWKNKTRSFSQSVKDPMTSAVCAKSKQRKETMAVFKHRFTNSVLLKYVSWTFPLKGNLPDVLLHYRPVLIGLGFPRDVRVMIPWILKNHWSISPVLCMWSSSFQIVYFLSVI